MRKDYYKILGITEDEKKLQGDEFEKVLKPKFRKIALENHPDKQVGKSDSEKKAAEERFKEASEAYEVLSDKNKRAEYDNPASQFNFNSYGMDFGNMGIDEIMRRFHMESMFSDFGFHGFEMNHEPQPQKGGSIKIKIFLTLEEVYSGVTKKIRYKRRELCSNCHGTGLTSESKKRTCPTCGGKGMVVGGNSFMMVKQTCPTCGGKGQIVDKPCGKCNGYGVVINDFETELTLPPGSIPGTEMLYQGLGHVAPHGEGENGDLIVEIYEKPNDKFKRNGADLYTKIEVPVLEAILGCEINVDTINGKKLLAKIPAGSKDGDSLKFNGYGLPVYGRSVTGNMIGVIYLVMPKVLNKEERKLLEELKTKEHFKHD